MPSFLRFIAVYSRRASRVHSHLEVLRPWPWRRQPLRASQRLSAREAKALSVPRERPGDRPSLLSPRVVHEPAEPEIERLPEATHRCFYVKQRFKMKQQMVKLLLNLC